MVGSGAQPAAGVKRKAGGKLEDGFLSKLATSISSLHRMGRGCLHCSTGQCYVAFASKMDLLRRWRNEFRSLPQAAQEQHLSWMFWHHGAGQGCLAGDNQDSQPKRQQQVECPTSDEEADRVPTSSTEEMAKEEKREEAVGAVERDDTTPDASDKEELDVAPSGKDCSSHAPKARTRPAIRQYGEGRPRKGRFSVGLLGHTLCVKAAMALAGVGPTQLYRIKAGLADGRRDATRRVRGPGGVPMNAPKMPSVLRFLWRLYQSVGEGMPDRFSFKRRDAKTLVVEPAGTGFCVKAEDDSEHEGDAAEVGSERDPLSAPALSHPDEEERTITASALYAESSRHPSEAALHGPSMPTGPLRFLPPTRRIHLFWEYVAWCYSQGCEAASFQTFLRAFEAARERLRIRTAGEHAKCDTCLELKRNIRKQVYPKDRQAAIETYTRHILDQWLDRQAGSHPNTWERAGRL